MVALPDVAGESSAATRIPWWLWWNVLSLDAPTVAVAWLAIFAKAARVQLAGAHFLILGAIVWCIYVSDRLLDGWTILDRGELRQRHIFCAKWRSVLVGLIGILGTATLALIAKTLPLREMVAGAAVAGMVGVYMAGIHAGGGGITRRIPREIAVGVVFACGTTLPLWSRGGVAEVGWAQLLGWAGWGFFAVLCCLNTLAIGCWEDDASGAGFFLERGRLGRLAGGVTVVALVMMLICAAIGGPWVEFAGVGLGAALLLAVHVARRKFSAEALRVLADVALLIPPMLALLA